MPKNTFKIVEHVLSNKIKKTKNCFESFNTEEKGLIHSIGYFKGKEIARREKVV